jgi:glucokinase
MTSGLILALDYGGTKHTAGVVAAGERDWRARRQAPATPGGNADTDRAVMSALAREVLAGETPAAIGVSFGGPVDYPSGTVRLSHHVPGWEAMPLARLLEAEFGAPAWVDNDANVAALGEHRFGAGQGCDSLMYITVSTGVGGGWILNGQPWRGQDGMAGEIGHTVVDPLGPVCLCGKRGCVERLASGPYLAQRARDLLAQDAERGSILRAMAGDDWGALDARLVAAAAARGDELAQSVLHEAGRALGVGIGNAANLVNPRRFVLGGGVTKSGEVFWQAVRQAARETALPQVFFDIVPAMLGDEAPLWGAVALAGAAQA